MYAPKQAGVISTQDAMRSSHQSGKTWWLSGLRAIRGLRMFWFPFPAPGHHFLITYLFRNRFVEKHYNVKSTAGVFRKKATGNRELIFKVPKEKTRLSLGNTGEIDSLKPTSANAVDV
jgi:hypothetical protein